MPSIIEISHPSLSRSLCLLVPLHAPMTETAVEYYATLGFCDTLDHIWVIFMVHDIIIIRKRPSIEFIELVKCITGHLLG